MPQSAYDRVETKISRTLWSLMTISVGKTAEEVCMKVWRQLIRGCAISLSLSSVCHSLSIVVYLSFSVFSPSPSLSPPIPLMTQCVTDCGSLTSFSRYEWNALILSSVSHSVSLSVTQSLSQSLSQSLRLIVSLLQYYKEPTLLIITHLTAQHVLTL